MGWYIFFILVAIAVQLGVSAAFSRYAEDKGHSGAPYFFACLFLGVAGYCMVAALPDLYLHDKLNKLIKLSETSAQPKVTAGTATHSTPISGSRPTYTPPEPGTWACKFCGTNNSNNYGMCKKCGKPR